MAVAAVALSGCGTDITTLEELRDAYVEAGGTCDDLSTSDDIGRWTETGMCDGSMLVFVYDDVEAREADLQAMKSDAEERDSKLRFTHGLYGDTWIIAPTGDSDEDYAIAREMDAKVASFPGT